MRTKITRTRPDERLKRVYGPGMGRVFKYPACFFAGESKMMKTGMIVLGHGCRRPQVARDFEGMVERIAALVSGALVLPAFFSLGEPTLPQQCKVLVDQGCTRIVVMPFFLFNGVHVEQDIPALVNDLQNQYMGVSFVVLSTLAGDPALEQLVAQRLLAI